jgi:hypothetical protein
VLVLDISMPENGFTYPNAVTNNVNGFLKCFNGVMLCERVTITDDYRITQFMNISLHNN